MPGWGTPIEISKTSTSVALKCYLDSEIGGAGIATHAKVFYSSSSSSGPWSETIPALNLIESDLDTFIYITVYGLIPGTQYWFKFRGTVTEEID